MRYLKAVGLAVVAAAALTMIAASSAQATVLCATTTVKCTAPYDAGETIEASLVANTEAEFNNAVIVSSCQGSTIKGKTENKGAANETVRWKIETLTFANCGCKPAVLANGKIEFHYTEKGAGFLSSDGTELEFVCIDKCKYKTVNIAYALYNEPKDLKSDTTFNVSTEMSKSGGDLLCPASLKWTGEYTVTKPLPLFLANEI